jgi:hypothetical protein
LLFLTNLPSTLMINVASTVDFRSHEDLLTRILIPNRRLFLCLCTFTRRFFFRIFYWAFIRSRWFWSEHIMIVAALLL